MCLGSITVTQEAHDHMLTNRLERWAPLALVLLFLLAMAGGVALLIEHNSPDGIEVVLPDSPTLQVHLSGEVQNPDVYQFDDGDRLADVLDAAGGTTADADLARVNLALRLRDEAHIHVPALSEAIPDSAQASDTSTPLNLNTATQEELEELPGIGPVQAAYVIAYGEDNGIYANLVDLLNVSGIIDLVTVE
jgi:competence protein ComEA